MLWQFLMGRLVWRWLERLGEPDTPPTASGHEPDVAYSPPQEIPDTPPATAEAGAPLTYPRVQRAAMGCLFEVFLAGSDGDHLTAAANEALDQVERLDRQLSHYRAESDVSRMNAHAAAQWVRLEPRLYDLLRKSVAVCDATGGAFDITASPLVDAWGFLRGEGRVPPAEEIAEVLDHVGSGLVAFNDDDHLVVYTKPGLRIDLGAVGKGYAVDEAIETLRFYGVRTGVVHGGRSTIFAMGAPPTAYQPDGDRADEGGLIGDPERGWRFVIRDPRDLQTPLEEVTVRDEALSTSGSYRQCFESDGVRYSHIIDPRSGYPVQGMLAVTVVGPSAWETDALSTAFFVMGRQATQEYCRERPNLRVIMVEERPDGGIEVTRIGFPGGVE